MCARQVIAFAALFALLILECTRRRAHPCKAAVSLASSHMQDLLNQALKPAPGLGPALLVNSTVYLLGIRVLLAGLLPSAVALSWVLGTVVYAAFGLGGYVLVCLYFILGSAVRLSQLVE